MKAKKSDCWFQNNLRQNKLRRILNEWDGTPFRHHCGVKGVGTDCVHMAIQVFTEMGLMDAKTIKIPDYPRDWHLHNTREALAEAITSHLKTELIDLSGVLMNGDVILSHYGKASSHVGIYCDGYVYQALSDIGVKRINFNDRKFRSSMKFVFRVLK